MYLLLCALLRKTLKLNWAKSSKDMPHSLFAITKCVCVCVCFSFQAFSRKGDYNGVYAKKRSVFGKNPLTDVE